MALREYSNMKPLRIFRMKYRLKAKLTLRLKSGKSFYMDRLDLEPIRSSVNVIDRLTRDKEIASLVYAPMIWAA